MATATKDKKSKAKVLELQNMIGGKFAAPAEGKMEDVTNPANGEVIAKAPLSTKKDVDAAVKAARKAATDWGNTTPGERMNMLLKLADAFEERGEEIADLESLDAGKPRNTTLEEEVPPMVDQLRFFGGAARCMEGKAAGEYLEGHTSFVRREPHGVCAQITPWNYPLMMAVWKIGPALATGNTLVLKPAETTPVTTLKILAEMCAEIFPPGVCNFVGGHGEPAGSTLVTHPEVDFVSLTGSPETGKWIAKAAADSLKRVHLELGGKAPVIIFDDADMETAMETIAGTGYFNAGQDCTAATRVLASKGVYDDVVSGLAEQAKDYKTGDTFDEDTVLGPLNSERQRDRVEGFLSDVPKGAEVVTGGNRPDLPGLLPRGDGRLRTGSEVGHDPEGDLRPRDHGAAVRRRGEGDRVGERHEVRPGLLGLDDGRGPRLPRLERDQVRVRLGQRPHPDRGRDAARRLQELRLRQGPLDVRAGGLHRGQARDGESLVADRESVASLRLGRPHVLTPLRRRSLAAAPRPSRLRSSRRPQLGRPCGP